MGLRTPNLAGEDRRPTLEEREPEAAVHLLEGKLGEIGVSSFFLIPWGEIGVSSFFLIPCDDSR